MALNYEVKKRVFGFDETKTEKYVAQMKTCLLYTSPSPRD